MPSEATRVRGVRHLSRPARGSDESERQEDGKVGQPEAYHPPQAVTVHHTDTPTADPDRLRTAAATR